MIEYTVCVDIYNKGTNKKIMITWIMIDLRLIQNKERNRTKKGQVSLNDIIESQNKKVDVFRLYLLQSYAYS